MADATAAKGPSRALAYWQLTKPRLWVMLTYTAAVGFLASLRVQPAPVLEVLVPVASVALGTAGANAVTCYLDRDVDRIMDRTKARPIPTGRVAPPAHALWFGLTLVVASFVVLLVLAHYVAAVIGFLGVFDNILVYAYWLKRTTPLNVILGGFSGGAPVLVGWSVNASPLSPVPLLMAAVVVLWIPSHIWSLAFRWREDYAKAGIPMLSVVVSPRTAMRCVASTSVLMFAFSLLLLAVGPFGLVYLLVAVVAGAVLLALTAWMVARPTGPGAFALFKYTSPYLALLLAAMAV